MNVVSFFDGMGCGIIALKRAGIDKQTSAKKMKKTICHIENKVRYSSERDAIKVIKLARKQKHHRNTFIPTRYYECDHCNG